MRTPWVLAALLLLPLVPSVPAAGPAPVSWGTYNAQSEVAALAFAREADTIAAALHAAVQQPSPGVPAVPGTGTANIAATDLAILQYESGFARNDTIAAPTPQGRSHVAVSRDGTSVASLGIDGATAAQEALHLRYLRVNAGANWSSTTPYTRDFQLGTAAAIPTPLGVAVSDDGRRVAVLTAEGTDYVVRGYSFGNTLDTAFEVRAPGTPRAMATSGDLARILVAGQFPEENFTYGGAHLHTFSQAPPMSSYLDRSANNTDVRGAALSREGDVALLGGADGRLHLFPAGALSSPATIALGSAPLANVTISEDASSAAVASGLTLTSLALDTGAPVARWNATLAGQNFTGFAMDRTGSLLVAGTGGTGGGVFAFDQQDATPLWSIPGDTRAVALDAEGTRLAYAQRSAIGASQLPRALTIDLVGSTNPKQASQRIVQIPGNTSYEVSLRNEGAATERVVLEEGAPEIGLHYTPTVVHVRPGAIVRVNVTVTVDDPIPGPRVFNLTARGLASGLVDNVTLAIAPKPTLDVKLEVNETDVLTEAGRTSEILVTIVNNGTGDSDVTLRATQAVSDGEDWNLTISETSLTALRGTRTSVKVLVTPPADAVNGTSSTVRFTLEGLDIFDVRQVTFRVNPDLKVDVSASGVTKFIEPGKRASYNVTVTNIGSLPREFDVFYTITDANGRSWGVDMQAQKVRLEPTQARTFPVSIVAPGDVQPNERVSVMVSARSIPEVVNESAVIDNVTLFGVAVPLKIPTPSTTPNAIPAATPLALVAVTLFVAVLLRRRSA